VPGQDLIERHAAELINWNGDRLRLVLRNQEAWVIKRSPTERDLRRELLLCSLARDLVNAAEVIRVSFSDIHHLLQMGLVDDRASPDNTLLIRLAQGYVAAELPLRDIDTATAGELVFSLWVRRRDAHSHNRAYTPDGLPVFFDLHASLDYEPWLRDCRTFFSRNVRGYAGGWRVAEDKERPANTIAARSTDVMYIRERARFMIAVEACVQRIQSSHCDLWAAVKRSGFSRSEAKFLVDFLETTKKGLRQDVSLMLDVIFAPDLRPE
jgi:hypothetical protein